MLTSVWAFLLTIGVLVVIHEYGHYRAAVACGVKVLRFSVGFGPVIWKRQVGETEFALSALPLGGYVKMLDEREGNVSPQDKLRAFNNKPLRQRAFVVAAGPLANLVLAVLLYAVVNLMGIEELTARVSAPQENSVMAQAGLQSGDTITALRSASASDDMADTPEWQPVLSFTTLQWLLTQSVIDGQDVQLQVQRRNNQNTAQTSTATLLVRTSKLDAGQVDGDLMGKLGITGPFSPALIGELLPDGPALISGLKVGDRVLRFNDKPVSDAAELRNAIAASQTPDHQAIPLTLTVDRAGQRVDVRITPVMKETEDGAKARIMAGVGGDVERVTVKYGVVDSLIKGVERTWDVAALSLKMLGRMVIGEASLRNLSGPISIADYAGQSADLGLSYYLGFLALVSVSLGVLNLLPLPVLDGGHLMYYLFEALSGRPVSELWLQRLQQGGMAVMLLMMSLALYNDFARLLGLH